MFLISYTAVFCYVQKLECVPNVTLIFVRNKVKVSLYRPRGLQQVEAPRSFRQLTYEGGKVVSPSHRLVLPPTECPCTHCC
jgi:hypothetical protein